MKNIFRSRVAAVGLGTLVLALGATGGAVAAGQIGSGDIANNSVRSVDIKNNQVRSSDIRDGDIRTEDLNAEVTAGIGGPQGPQGPQGSQGPEGPRGPAGADAATQVQLAPAGNTTYEYDYDTAQIVATSACPDGKVAIGANTRIPQNNYAETVRSRQVNGGWELLVKYDPSYWYGYSVEVRALCI